MDDIKKFKREQRKKKFKQTVTRIVVDGEKAIYKGKKLMVIVIIPALEVLANLLTLMDEESKDDHDDWY